MMEAKVCAVCGGFTDGVIWMVDAPVCKCPTPSYGLLIPMDVELAPTNPAPYHLPLPYRLVAWECPRYRRINAPHVNHCDCPPGSFTFTSSMTVTS